MYIQFTIHSLRKRAYAIQRPSLDFFGLGGNRRGEAFMSYTARSWCEQAVFSKHPQQAEGCCNNRSSAFLEFLAWKVLEEALEQCILEIGPMLSLTTIRHVCERNRISSSPRCNPSASRQDDPRLERLADISPEQAMATNSERCKCIATLAADGTW